MSEGGRKRPPTTNPALPRTSTPTLPLPKLADPRPARGTPSTAGSLAVASWLADRGCFPPANRPWRVQIALETSDRPASFGFAPTRFVLTIEPRTWGFAFHHGDRTSTIRIDSIASALDRDEHRLAAMTPPLKRIGSLVRDLEARYRIFFPRHHAAVRSDIPGSEPMIRAWVQSF
ncbi:MAG TPA: hypothetical protein VFQ53_31030 [Kofleriaceae bacterium]|nr:hypothetical protein [Kofleriaceae bacterium]